MPASQGAKVELSVDASYGESSHGYLLRLRFCATEVIKSSA